MATYTFQGLAPPSPTATTQRLWTKGNYQKISEKLDEFDWRFEFAGMSSREMNSSLLKIIERLVDRFVPKAMRCKTKPPWTLNPPRTLLHRKSLLFSNYKQVRETRARNHPETIAAWRNFTEANNDVKQFARRSQEAYEVSIANQIKTNPKLFHAYLKHRKVGRLTIDPLKVDNNVITDDPKRMAKQFAHSFRSVFETTSPQRPAPNQLSETVLQDISVTALDVQREIATLDPNSSMGADGIHPRLLLRCSSSLSQPLSLIYNASLNERLLPIEWLSSQITPIFKKGPRTDPLNYRPVAITSVPCKVLEKAIVSHIRPYLEDNQLLSEHQYGFRSKHSTIDQLIVCYDEITRDQGRHFRFYQGGSTAPPCPSPDADPPLKISPRIWPIINPKSVIFSIFFLFFTKN